MLASIRSSRSWVWWASALLTAAALMSTYGLSGKLSVPDVDWLPERERAPVPVDGGGQWKALPSKAVSGWLPESRWSRTPAFDVRNCSVHIADILDMPPGPEDIPSIDGPRFVAAESARWLRARDEVLGVTVGDVSRCYPLPILRWHNVINDIVGGRPLAILFDPLSGASMAFSRLVGGETLSFGVSGKAYNGGALLHDREHRNLWYPLRAECIAGPWAGRARLAQVFIERTTWPQWRERNAQTQVLSRNTGVGRAYGIDPYARAPIGPDGATVDYWADPDLILAPLPADLPMRGLDAKRLVLGVRVRGKATAWSGPATATSPVRFHGQVSGAVLHGVCDLRPGVRAFRAADAADKRPWQVTCFWCAWLAAYPRTGLTRLDGGGLAREPTPSARGS